MKVWKIIVFFFKGKRYIQALLKVVQNFRWMLKQSFVEKNWKYLYYTFDPIIFYTLSLECHRKVLKMSF